MSRRVFASVLCVLLTVGPEAARTATPSAPVAETNWYTHGGTHDENNFSPLAEISSGNVSRLGLSWSLDLPGAVTLEGTPLAIDGVLYFSGSYSDVYAVEAASGRLLWRHDPQIWKHRPEHMKLIWGINRGVAYSHGKVFVGTLDGRLQALDAKSGRLLWSVKTVADDSARTISGAPWVVRGKVLIGHGGADFGARGYVTAYDEQTGQQRWRFYTVPGDPAKGYEVDPSQRKVMKMAAATWGKEWWKIGGGGGTVWDNMTYDPELNRIYIGVGNAFPYNPRIRSPGGGDNLFICSIVALDPDTGEYIWHYQTNPGESWDFKSTSNMMTATVTIEGKPRKVLMQSPSNGFFYTLDRETGKLISAGKTGKVTWAERIDVATGRPVETGNIRYENGPVEIWPSPFGTHNWQGMAHDPGRGLAFIPYMQIGARLTDDKTPVIDLVDPAFHMAGVYVQLLIRDAEDGKGALVAWDPIEQAPRWKVQHPSYWNGGPLATAGGLVFQGTADGPLIAYDSLTGAERWQFDAKLGIIATPISYTVGGKQQISVLVGPGGSIAPVSHLSNRGFKYGAQPRRLLTFTLDGRARLPPTAPRDFVVHALDDPTLTLDPTQARLGGQLFQNNCAYCHGRLLVSPGSPGPDLRESTIALEWEAFRTTVKEGPLLAKLMPRFAELSDEQVRAIFMYIRTGARDVLSKQQASHQDDGSSAK